MPRPHPAPHLSPPVLFLLLAVPASGQGFVERSAELDIVHEVATGFDRIGASAVVDWTQRGLALADFDGDGDPDLICCGGLLPNSVLRNDGGTFVDVTSTAGIEVGDFDTAPCLADVDGDGDLDLYVAVLAGGADGSGLGLPARGRMYRNDGSGIFTEVSDLAATPGRGHSLFAQWADLDSDGLVDLLVSEFYNVPNVYYRNNGDGTFTDLSVETGLDTTGATHVTCIVDSDDDGISDVMVGNDFVIAEWLDFPNNIGDRHLAGQEDGTWLDVSVDSGFDHERGIMGLTVGDVDYDGRFDIYKADVGQNRLTLNRGWPGGEAWLGEEQEVYGVAVEFAPWPDDPGEMGKAVAWGAVFVDLDFDLWLDLFVVNGMVPGIHIGTEFSPRKQPNNFLRGEGPATGFTFTDQTQAFGLYDEIDDRCLAVGDPDQDGDIDLFIQPTTGSLRYFENQVDPQGQGWLMVQPICQTSAPGGFGVEVEFTDSFGYPHIRQIGQDGPTASQHENFAYFGLGDETAVDLTVTFPSGIQLDLPALAPNQRIQPVEPKLIEVNARTLPIGLNPTLPGNRNAPTLALPADLYAVTVWAHDSAGNALDENATVAIETPGLTPKTPVLHLGGNQFRRYFDVPDAPGEFRAQVTIDGWDVKIRPRIIFFDPDDVTGTTVQLVPEAVRAGSADTVEVWVAPKAAGGVSLGSGDTVDILVGGQSPLGPVLDLGDGRYRATFAAPALPGAYAVSVLVNGMALPAPDPLLEAGGTTVNAQSSFILETPNINTSAAPHQLKLLVNPRDKNGWRLGPDAALSVVPVADPGTAEITVRSDLHPGGQGDGDHVFILEKPSTVPPTAVSGTLELWVDGQLQVLIPYTF